MSDKEPAYKTFAPTEKELYEEFVDKNTAETLENLDAMRPALKMYPQGYHLVRDALYEMPYVGEGGTAPKSNEKFDAFYARRIADILYSFALRIRAVGFEDDSPEILSMQNVDLSAAHDVSPEAPPEPDNEAIRESFMDNSGITDTDIAAHGDRADQRAIDEQHAQSRHTDREIASQEAEEVAAIVKELGGKIRIGNIFGDDDVEVEGTGGSGSVQLGMLYSSGSSLGGDMCARNCVRLFFNAVLHGSKKRFGLAKHLQILTQYGEITQAEIDLLVEKIQEQVTAL
ncbi:hypothetical protein COU78_05215 [Candidatus Peregrinibacteria bacterium CG10_big_fil_rev_8_21_14_0_10_49_24]|nr:MAG: hypothetical protein COV83_01585 [Candidatus Peregrinibacteria bacterium CG11_big_fil_rev_8_21_14_0_20_49_14]PIR50745.1 MAG: hypothetical protein COU78_05215 [Candidatus Peregrinibacteria bacterium CG10_big_fil_rev_8_21_14_0_10_49_24]